MTAPAPQTDGRQWIMLPARIAQDVHILDRLTPAALRVLFVVGLVANTKSGEFFLSTRTAAKYCRGSHTSAAKGLAQLESLGIIERIAEAKGRHATTYRFRADTPRAPASRGATDSVCAPAGPDSRPNQSLVAPQPEPCCAPAGRGATCSTCSTNSSNEARAAAAAVGAPTQAPAEGPPPAAPDQEPPEVAQLRDWWGAETCERLLAEHQPTLERLRQIVAAASAPGVKSRGAFARSMVTEGWTRTESPASAAPATGEAALEASGNYLDDIRRHESAAAEASSAAEARIAASDDAELEALAAEVLASVPPKEAELLRRRNLRGPCWRPYLLRELASSATPADSTP